MVRRRGPWERLEDVDFAALVWVEWFNNRRLLEPTGEVSPEGLEAEYYRLQSGRAVAA